MLFVFVNEALHASSNTVVV